MGDLPDGNDMISDQEGMSLRDYFAAKAMQALFSNNEALQSLQKSITESKIGEERWADSANRVISKRAYMLADAMLAAREKPVSLSPSGASRV